MRSKIFNDVFMEEVVIHKFKMPSYTDFYKFKFEEFDQWRESEKGKWISDRVQGVTEHSYRDHEMDGQVVIFTGFLKPVDKTFMLLKWPENNS